VWGFGSCVIVVIFDLLGPNVPLGKFVIRNLEIRNRVRLTKQRCANIRVVERNLNSQVSICLRLRVALIGESQFISRRHRLINQPCPDPFRHLEDGFRNDHEIWVYFRLCRDPRTAFYAAFLAYVGGEAFKAICHRKQSVG
jgi:hypothetical protein